MNRLNARGMCAALLSALFVAGCGGLSEYRIDIQQGNVVSGEAVAQLRQGMTRDQVRFLLGTPLLQDLFHADRWDYVYRLDKRSAGRVEQNRLAVFFDTDGRVLRWQGDLPANADAAGQQRPRMIDLGSDAARSGG